MRGLPGSGKSTWAKQILLENPNAYKRINRDELRMMFDNGYNSRGNERFIKKVRDLLITQALQEGKHVIIDDTNLAQANLVRIRQLVEEFNKTTNDNVVVEVMEMDVPVEECIRRDAQREKPVGGKVIRNMHHEFYGNQTNLVQDATLPKAIVCDLDGTLALLNGRNPYDTSGCVNDLLNAPVANTLAVYGNLGHAIILVSGRQEIHRAETESWLAKQGIIYHSLYMRPTDDTRMDALVKREIYEWHLANKYYIEFVLDDRNQVVDMWRREIGLPVFQVNYGDF